MSQWRFRPKRFIIHAATPFGFDRYATGWVCRWMPLREPSAWPALPWPGGKPPTLGPALRAPKVAW